MGVPVWEERSESRRGKRGKGEGGFKRTNSAGLFSKWGILSLKRKWGKWKTERVLEKRGGFHETLERMDRQRCRGLLLKINFLFKSFLKAGPLMGEEEEETFPLEGK